MEQDFNVKVMKTEKDFLTPSERFREERNRRVCSRYCSLRNQMPELSTNRLVTAIAREENMTALGIKNIIVKAGLYQTKR